MSVERGLQACAVRLANADLHTDLGAKTSLDQGRERSVEVDSQPHLKSGEMGSKKLVVSSSNSATESKVSLKPAAVDAEGVHGDGAKAEKTAKKSKAADILGQPDDVKEDDHTTPAAATTS
jgi:hypothetical protein